MMSAFASRLLCLALALCAPVGAALAATSIWTNSASYGPPILQEWDMNGNFIRLIPSSAMHGSNGRGIVQVANILYYTTPYSNAVYGYDLSGSGTDLGTIFTVPSATGLASMAFDGSSLYIEDYSGANIVYKYSVTGSPQGSISLANCPSSSSTCDGLEYANGRLVSNRGDGIGPYDVYATGGGSVQSPALISDSSNTDTGIAFDGTHYYVSRVSLGQIAVFSSSGAYQSAITLASGHPHSVEDISVDYAAVLNTNTLKLCKAAGLGVTVGTPFAFNVNGNPLNIPAGPQPGGYCVVAGSFAQNAPVLVQETGPLGYTVANITVAPATSLVGMPDLLNKKVQLSMGNGATDVTFTDEKTKGETGYLEICKRGHVVGNFSFTITPGNIGPIVVPAGVCSPAIKVMGGQVTIHEAPSSSTVMTGCATIPANRQGPCNPAGWSSTVSAAGGISSETTAIITDAPFFHDDGSGHIERRALPEPQGGGNCRDYDPTKRMPQRCMCPEGSGMKDGKCVQSGGLLDNFHVGIGIGVGGSEGHGGKGKTCNPDGPVPCP
jgi:hypothetical protein